LRNTVGIFDNDGLNPYGQELSNITEFLGYRTQIYYGQRLSSGKHGPVKSSSNSTRRKSDFWRFAISAVNRDCNIIAWASTKQKVLLIILAILFRPNLLYVSHNPVIGRAPSGFRGLVEKTLIRRSINVVHGPTISQLFWELYQLNPLVAYHPPYMSAFSAQKEKKFQELGMKNKAFQMKEFVSRLLERCDDLTVVLAQRPRVDLEIESDRLLNFSSDSPIDEHKLYELLSSCDLIVSPSSNVTESGTVILANSMSLKCVAFDSPELRKHLLPGALAKPDDFDSFLEKSLDALNDPNFKSAKWSPDEWFKASCESWNDAIHFAMSKKK
jgi:glycosyltransferase involved in cell wall biosynthesis